MNLPYLPMFLIKKEGREQDVTMSGAAARTGVIRNNSKDTHIKKWNNGYVANVIKKSNRINRMIIIDQKW